MKICHITPYFPYKEHINGKTVEKGYHVGGVERHVYHVSRELSELGHSVTILTTKSPIHNNLTEVDLDINILRVPIDLRIYTSCIPLLMFKCLHKIEYDVIHAHTPVPAVADLAALQNIKQKRPFILTYHNDIGKEGFFGGTIATIYNNTIGSFLLRHADVIIATSRSYAINSVQLKKHLSKVKVIPNGVDLEIFHPRLDGKRLIIKHGVSKDSKIVLFVGKIDHYKGCDYLLRAFASVVKIFSQSHLIFVGSGSLEGKMKQMAIDLKITSNVTFLRNISDQDLPSCYAACDVFALPSISFHEGFGMVQLEAMACGKPVVTTSIPGVKEVDADGVATIHVPPKNEKALESAIIRILQDEKLRRRMCRNARKKAEGYSWRRVAMEIENVYKKVMT